MQYQKEFAVCAAALRRVGLSRAQIGAFLNLTPRTIAAFARRHREFAEALAVSPSAEDCREAVEAALLRRALGFRQEEEYSEDVVDRKSGEVLGEVKRRTVRKEVPPDVRALLFWLKNRHPERWRDRVELPEEGGDYEFDAADERL